MKENDYMNHLERIYGSIDWYAEKLQYSSGENIIITRKQISLLLSYLHYMHYFKKISILQEIWFTI